MFVGVTVSGSTNAMDSSTRAESLRNARVDGDLRRRPNPDSGFRDFRTGSAGVACLEGCLFAGGGSDTAGQCTHCATIKL